jgi:gliding motility-associated-like protein
MDMMKKLSSIVGLLFGISMSSTAQDIPIQVINSSGGGGNVGSTGVEVYYNIGETVISTISDPSVTVTQGFLQPDIVGKFGLTATYVKNNVSCNMKQDGNVIITASVSGVMAQSAYAISYYWEPSSVCPGNNCASVSGLAPGNYSVLVVSSYTGTTTTPIDSVMLTNIIISDNTDPCMIEIFNGITPNGDGNNDFFYIGNIEQYPDNTVDIYNRWGQHLSHIKGYDNNDKKWAGTTNGETVAPSGTYFYVIDLNNGSKPFKGWIELIRR